jgi:uncharacterized Zn-finger protein
MCNLVTEIKYNKHKPETISTNSRKVKCDGGKGALGHPTIYLRINDNEKEITCPYCSRIFTLK